MPVARRSSRGIAGRASGRVRNGAGPARKVLVRAQVSDIQRARIVAGMVEVVAERGAANVTVADVVACSGVSRRTFYEIFEDREACFLAALDDAIERASERVLADYDPSAGWRERIACALLGLLSFLDEEPDLGRLLIVESLGAGPSALERRVSLMGEMVTIADGGRSQTQRAHKPPPLTAEGVVGGVLSVLHTRLLDRPLVTRSGSRTVTEGPRILDLAGPLMSMIVLPYLGSAAAQRELERPVPHPTTRVRMGSTNPLRDLEIRLTYRTVRVLLSVAAHPGSSNREIGVASGIQDQGQISKLLSRLQRIGLIANTGIGPTQGAPNAWSLTTTGEQVADSINAYTHPTTPQGETA